MKTMRNTLDVTNTSNLADMLPAEAGLNDAQLAFLNPASCQHVNPYGKLFWQEMAAWLSQISSQAAEAPRSPTYRDMLEPYLLRRVHMTAGSWSIEEICPGRRLRLLLQDVRLDHVRSADLGASPDVVTDHMNIWVSISWLNRVIPDPSEPLSINGMLYEYVSRKTRNIGVLPVLLAPQSRRLGGSCAKKPGTAITDERLCA